MYQHQTFGETIIYEVVGYEPYLLALLSCLALCACGENDTRQETAPSATASTVQASEPKEESILKISIGEQELDAVFADNPSAEAFRQLLQQGPVTVEMTDYGGFEKVDRKSVV